MQLRKVCNHPYLLATPSEEEEISDDQRSEVGSCAEARAGGRTGGQANGRAGGLVGGQVGHTLIPRARAAQMMIEHSGKMSVLDKLLRKLKVGGSVRSAVRAR
jgi:hypothetical protein